MKILGLDLGSVTLGMAVSDVNEILASPREIYRFKENDFTSAINYTLEVLKEIASNKVVLGYPKNMNNTLGERAKTSIEFKKELEKAGVEVILWDERLSTVEVTKVMIKADLSRKKRKKHVDKLAAVVILQGYLDSKRR